MSSVIASNDSLARVEKDIAPTKGEIHQRMIFLANLCSKRNSFLPVFTLPPKILEVIFIHGARDYYERDGERFTPCIPTWVNVSYVCSHWRNIAFNCPTLWTYHFNLSLRWTEELPFRSKQASLKISCTSPCDPQVSWWSDLLDNLLEHSDRIQELRLNVPLSIFPAKLRTPRLEILEIGFLEQPEETLGIDADTPVLRILKLSSCLLPWSSFNLSRLKILSISHYDPSQLNIVEFLVALGSMQDLTVLHLDGLPSSRDFPSGGLGVSHKVDLPRLALLAVIGRLSAVMAFLSCVEIPLKAHLSLEPHLESDAAEDYASLSSFLAQRFSKAEQLSSGPIFRSLTIMNNCALAALTFSSLERDCRNRIPHGELDCDIPLQVSVRAFRGFGVEDRNAQLQHVVADICYALPLINVQALCVDVSLPYELKFLKEILGCLDGLRYLKLHDGEMPDLSMLSLTAPPKEDSDGQPIHAQDPTLRRILVPALEELELVRMYFPSNDYPARCGGMSQKSLFDVLSTRKGLRDRAIMIKCRS